MKTAVFDYHGMYRGERWVEVQWVREKLFGANNQTIVDVGCLNREGGNVFVGTHKYCINNSNTVIPIDQCSPPVVLGEYFVFDILDKEPRGKVGGADVILCISVLEHIGLDAYGGKVICDGDVVAMRNMVSMLNCGGRILLTVPGGPKCRMENSWIRVYSPGRLKQICEECGAVAEVDIYSFVSGSWKRLDGPGEMGKVKPIPDKCGADTVLCATITHRMDKK